MNKTGDIVQSPREVCINYKHSVTIKSETLVALLDKHNKLTSTNSPKGIRCTCVFRTCARVWGVRKSMSRESSLPEEREIHWQN